MTVESGDIRKRLKRVIEESRREARERRARAEAASGDGERLLRVVVAPIFRQMAQVLKAEGHLFKVSTPKEAVQLVAEGPGENRIELALDTTVDPPCLAEPSPFARVGAGCWWTRRSSERAWPSRP